MGAVENLVPGHDDVSVTRDAQALAGKALALEVLELLENDHGIDDAAVADDGKDVLVDDARRNLVKCEVVTIGDNRVAGVGTAAIATDHIEVTGDEVGDLTLALVAPLGSHQNRCRHEELLLLRLSKPFEYTPTTAP